MSGTDIPDGARMCKMSCAGDVIITPQYAGGKIDGYKVEAVNPKNKSHLVNVLGFRSVQGENGNVQRSVTSIDILYRDVDEAFRRGR